MKKKKIKKITVYILAASCAINNLAVLPVMAKTETVPIVSDYVASPSNTLRTANTRTYTIKVVSLSDESIEIPNVRIEAFHNGSSIGTYESNSNGEIEIPDLAEDSLANEEYTFKIIDAPKEYSFDESREFTMGGLIDDNLVTGTTLKLGDAVKTLDYVKVIAVENGTNEPITGVTIGLYNEDYEEIETLTTGVDGTVTFTELEEGTYFYKVEEVPEDYSTKGEFHELVLTSQNWISSITLEINNKNNPVEERQLTVSVVDQNDNSIKIKNATVALYTTENVLVGTATTNDNGEAVFRDLTESKYILREVTMPEGYTANTEREHKISFSEEATEGSYTIQKLNSDSQITNTTLFFYDKSTGEGITGITVKILTEDGMEYGTFSDTNGKIELPDIPDGNYKLEFTTIPDEYINQIWSFTVNGVNIFNFELSRKDEVTSGSFEINVLNSDKEKVDGVRILIESEDGDYSQTKETVNGIISLDDLQLGKYTYQFIDVPDGYALPSDPYSFEITADKADYRINFTLGNMSGEQNEKGLTLHFVDSSNDSIKVDVSGTLYKGDEKISDFTTVNGEYLFEDLTPGTYVLNVTSANGYQVPEESFTINMTADSFGYTLKLNKESESYTLKTTVQDKDGNPISGVQVKFMTNDSEIGTYTSDEDGLITVSGFTNKEISYQVISVPEGYYLDSRIGKLTLDDSYGTYTYDLTVENENEVSGTYHFKVVDENNNVIPNVIITIVNSETGRNYIKSTNQSGIATFTELPLGEYTFKITYLPGGNDAPVYDDYTFEVTLTETTKTLQVNSRESHFDINFYDSNDKDSEIKTLLKGFVIEIYDSNNKEVEFDKNYNGSVSITDAEPGEYYFIILSAPTGYESYVSNEHHDFTIGENQSALNFYFTKEAEKETGTYKFKVVDDNENPVSGVVIQIKNESTGTTYMETSNNDGIVVFDDMEFGNYTFLINRVPDGYEIPTYTDYTFEITNVTTTMTLPIKIKDETPQETTLNIHFYDVEDQENETKTLLTGFAIDVYNESGEIVNVINNADGSFTLEDILPGNYYYIITNAPDEYSAHITDEPHSFTVKESQISYDLYFNKAEKEMGKGTVTVLDEDGNPVSGVTVKINNDIYTTDESGIINVTDLENGVYTVSVTNAPLEYIFSTETHKFEITDSVKSFSLTSNLQRVEGSIAIAIQNNGTPVSNVKVQLTNDDTEDIFTGATKDGNVLFEDIPAGDYTISIVSVPSGYELPEDTHAVTINRNNLSDTININLAEKTGTVHFNVLNDEKPDVKIQVYGNGVDETVSLSEGTGLLSGLKYGTYHYRIISVPDDYIDDTNEYSFTIDEATENVNISINKFYGSLTINVKDDADENVIGTIKGTLLNIDDSTSQEIEITNSTITLNNIKPGNYRLTINEYPDGYTGQTVTRTFTINKTTSTSFIYNLVINKVKYGNAIISVLDEEGNFVEGISYIIKDENSEIKRGTTSGSAITENLEYGTYTIEFTLPDNYETEDSLKQTLTINQENINISLNVSEKVEGTITVTVQDKDGNLIENVSVRILGNGMNIIKLTDTSGNVTVNDLKAGNYTISIVDVPDGYVLDSTSKVIEISKENETGNAVFEIEEETSDITTITLPVKDIDTDENIDGTLTLYKDGLLVGTYSSLNGIITINNLSDGVYTYTMEAENYQTLENGTFTIVDGNLQNNSEIYLSKKEKTIKIQFVDAETNELVNGVGISMDDEDITVDGSIDKTFKYGTYLMTVRTIPNGYKLLNDADQTQTITINDKTDNLTIYLKKDEVRVTFNLKDSYSNEYITTGLLSIYDETDKLVETLDLSKDSEIPLPKGHYYAILTDEIHSQSKIEFNVIDTSVSFVNVNIDRKNSNLIFVIEDENESPVENADIILTSSTGEIISLTTDETGKIDKELKYDTYSYVVKKDGYQDTTGTLIVRSGNANIELTLKKETSEPEEPEKGTISLEVKDENGNSIKDITITINKVEEDGTETLIGNYKTDENGKINLSGLEDGKYHLISQSSDEYDIVLDTIIEITDSNSNIEIPVTVETKEPENPGDNTSESDKPINGSYSGYNGSDNSSRNDNINSNTGWVYNSGTDTWTYNNHMYRNEWALIYNPYSNDSDKTAWFHFDSNGNMQTGWFTDTDGNIYYLQEISDGNRGKLLSGWNWINGKCYYFNETHDGTFGKLIKNTMTPDGYYVNENGEWEVNGIIVQR